MKDEKALALLSGGMDSAVAFKYGLEQCESVDVIFFNYGQKTFLKEHQCSLDLATRHNSKLYLIPVDLSYLDASILAHSDRPSRWKDYPPSFVPGRNIIQLAYAGSLALKIGASRIYGGWNQVDYSGYPDCKAEFLQDMVQALGHGLDYHEIEIHAPLLNKTKAEIVQLGTKLGLDFKLTWSCYERTDKPCRKCPSCKLREKAFEQAGLPDPLLE